ncbi:MAG: DNA replication/repair protein RecF, partial [Rhodospirillales bacterium]
MSARPLMQMAPANDTGFPVGCYLNRLTLTDFRNHANLRLEVSETAVVLVGPNGAGKTNILEAISLLTPGRGMRGSRVNEITRIGGAGGWAAAASVIGPLGESQVGVGIDPGQVSHSRQVRVDGDAAKGQASLAERFSALWLTPQMDGLFSGAAEERRRYLDRIVAASDPAHIGRVSSYRNAMRQRLSLLKSGTADVTWLDALEAEMAGRAVAVAAARIETAALLDAAAAEGVTAFPRASVMVEGLIEGWLNEVPALEAEDRMREVLAEERRHDAETGMTTSGPHRTDMVIFDRSRNMPAAVGSTGEQKALLVSLTFASARMIERTTGCAPALLLDEVAAHFDPNRRHALFDEALALGGQVWVTGADKLQLSALDDRADWLC